jgi:hypothetical protein
MGVANGTFCSIYGGAPVATGNVIGYAFDCVDAEARVTCELTLN